MLSRALLAILLVAAVAAGDEKTDWREQADKHLTPAQVKILARQKIVLTDEEFKQVFTPYLYGGLPVFITSDSLINAFHVVLEESVYRMERVNAARLPAFLEHTLARVDDAAKDYPAKPEMVAAAKRRARVFLGTALRLSKDGAGKFDEPTTKLIRAEVARVTEATGTSKPDWLGPKDPGFVAIEYSRFRPRGFYMRSTELQRYFRTLSWLQAIPFRVEKDEELLAALILSRAAVVPNKPELEVARRGRATLDCFREFLGSGDDWSLDLLARYHDEIKRTPWADRHDQTMLEWLRAELTSRAKGDRRPQINDHIAFIPDDPSAAAEISIRVATPYRLPDAVLFQRTTDPRSAKREWPSGLDLAAALGSPYARRHLGKDGGREVLTLIDRNSKLLLPAPRYDDEVETRSWYRSSLYSDYLTCLGELLAKSEPDWPAFMKSEAWQAKTCQTALAGWAQMRHTWVLQAKVQITYLSSAKEPTGFVEPVPEFYGKLGNLCERCTEVLSRAGAFADDPGATVEWLEREVASAAISWSEELMGILGKVQEAKTCAEALRKLSKEDRDKVDELDKKLHLYDSDAVQRPEQFRAWLDALARYRDKKARQLEADVDLAPRWKELRDLCSRLELMSHKQLRGRDFSGAEKAFLRGYAKKLGWLMLYDGNSYKDPRDDAPRVADVFASRGKYLEVGIGKPRLIYVLYPWQGKDVFCRGAVLPYHEFVHAERLSDEDWRRMLKSPGRPGLPPWARILSDGNGTE